MKITVVLFVLVLITLLVDALIIVDAQESVVPVGAAAAAAGGADETAGAEDLPMTPAADGKKLDLKGADAKKIQEEFCNTLCLEKAPAEKGGCMETCGISKKATLVLTDGVMCLAKCAEPTKKPCEDDCNKLYQEKAAEVAALCNQACTKLEKDPGRLESCKSGCSPPPTPN